jgi:hypothetical protein
VVTANSEVAVRAIFNGISEITYEKLAPEDPTGFDNFELNEVEQLIKNRDLLVETFKIKFYICSTKIPKYILNQIIIYNNNINNNLNDYRDHIEYYKTQDGNILSIFSIYVSPEDNMINELYKNNGYKLFVPIYDKNQNTYFKLILK